MASIVWGSLENRKYLVSVAALKKKFMSEYVNSLSWYLVQSNVKFLIQLKKILPSHLCSHSILLYTKQKRLRIFKGVLLLEKKEENVSFFMFVLLSLASKCKPAFFGFHVQYWREVNLRWIILHCCVCVWKAESMALLVLIHK